MCIRDSHVTVFANDENEDSSVVDEIDFDEPKQKEPKLGFFSKPVSYTHLDVYKRQSQHSCLFQSSHQPK